ncbi:hypothetical protein HPB50_004686 [Hyalomma asiaticum]|uniref:Uncharacterized protein n=1 Tax=Hyalomma asiaticum TaxID=266040 RepID=A0ACB7SSA8_HYAAI|nr:hypothetical protein HPB50_004686 [Hyalomma asiaticum]
MRPSIPRLCSRTLAVPRRGAARVADPATLTPFPSGGGSRLAQPATLMQDGQVRAWHLAGESPRATLAVRALRSAGGSRPASARLSLAGVDCWALGGWLGNVVSLFVTASIAVPWDQRCTAYT